MSSKEQWATRVGLVLAMAGNAVGLGNFLRFPAQAAQNGGGAFLIPYLVSFALMGIPLLWVEWAIGRHGGIYGYHSTPGMFHVMGEQSWLKYIGVFGIFTNLTIAAYYCYIESWTLSYVFHSLIGTFAQTDPKIFFSDYVGETAHSLFAFPLEAGIWFLITLALNIWILSKGLAKGIEMAAKIGMPLLILFAIILVVRGLTLPEGAPGVVQSPLDGLNFVWNPKLEGLTQPTTWLAAAGQIFFTLSLGMGAIHCYASYVSKRSDIALNAASAGWMNEFVEVILGGSLLIPIATAYMGLGAVQSATAGGGGFSLGFLSLPTLFNNWGWFAPIAGAMWFGLLFFAGITSSLAMGQPIMAYFQDEHEMSREKSAWLFGVSILILGLFCVWLYPGGAFDEYDFWSGTFSLVVFALLEVFIFSFVFGIDKGWKEITRGADIRVPKIFRFIIKYITPVFILVVFIGALIQPAEGNWILACQSLMSGDSWPFAANSVIGKLFHVGVDSAWFTSEGMGTKVMVQDITRLLLFALFAGIAVMIYLDFRRKGGSR
ncbi:MAG: sodium-dependent transporter [Deltaproteobacteria bacterium]|nr:sodium-dependent transporter [Deltaproteobacteria bacterium]